MSTAKKDIVPGTVVEVNFGPRLGYPVIVSDKQPTKMYVDADATYLEIPIGDTLVILSKPLKINQKFEYYTQEVIPSQRHKMTDYRQNVYVEIEWNGKLWYANYGGIRYGTSVKPGIKYSIY